MTTVLKQRLHAAIAESVYTEIQSRRSRYYYFLGKTLGFETTGAETPTNTLAYEAATRNEIILMKNISSSDVSFVIPRINWTTGAVYDMYRFDLDEAASNFYVLNETNFSVYKCLDNNEGGPSTVIPSNTDLLPFVTADGYKWKFMYNIPLSLRNKFLTASHIPVTNAIKNRFYSNGGIDSITITAAGSGYTQGTTTITVVGDGTGAIIDPVIVSGQLVDVTIVNPGSGYTYGVLTIVGIGTGALATANTSMGDLISTQALVEQLAIPGTIDTITVDAGGSAYTTATVSIVGDGTGASATATIVSGVITKITMTNIGSDYTTATALITGDGTGAAATAHVSPVKGHGKNAVEELRSSTLMFTGKLNQTLISGLELNNDYRQVGIIRNPDSTTNTSLISNPAAENIYAVTGSFTVASYPVNTPLSDGSNDYIVVGVIVGNGTDGLLVKSLDNVEVVTGMVLSRTAPSDSFTVTSSVAQEFLESSIGTSCYTVSATFSTTTFPRDTTLESVSGDKFVVITFDDDGTKMVILPITNGTLANGQVLTKVGTSTQLNIVTVDDVPTVNKFSGDMLYIDNRSPFFQTGEQAITFRTVVNF